MGTNPENLDKRFKDTGHENVYMPMFIPESLLQRKRIMLRICTRSGMGNPGGEEKLTERLCVRPTSETLFCEHYANIIHSYRDLLNYIINGVLLFVGKRPPVLSCVRLSFCGRRVILRMLPKRKQWKKLYGC